MALVPCRECGKKVSTEAVTCPHCGIAEPVTAASAEARYLKDIQQGRRKGAWKGAWAIAIVFLFLLGWLIFSLRPSPKDTTPPRAASLTVTIQKEEYRYGYLTLVGVVENVGTAPAYNPEIRVQVNRGNTVLAEDSAWPAGTFLKELRVGDSAAFESITRVPGKPLNIGYSVSIKNYPYEVRYPPK